MWDRVSNDLFDLPYSRYKIYKQPYDILGRPAIFFHTSIHGRRWDKIEGNANIDNSGARQQSWEVAADVLRTYMCPWCNYPRNVSNGADRQKYSCTGTASCTQSRAGLHP